MASRPPQVLLAWSLLAGCSGPGYAGLGEVTTGGSSTEAATPTSTGDAASTGTTGIVTGTTSGGGTSSTGGGTASAGDTSTGTSAVCGNGEIDPGEQCDEGYAANDDGGSCTLGCQRAVCGDGLVWAGHEACDDGDNNNDTLYSACTTACARGGHCDDGVVQKPFEECDLGALNNTGESPVGGVPCTGCRLEARLVFLSSETYTGKQLKGLSGADELCSLLAEKSGLDNSPSFLAWLSTGGAYPGSRFNHDDMQDGVAYALLDGRRIADDWLDLVANGVDEGIYLTELGEELTDVYVWTNTDASGYVFDADNDCDGWTSDSFLSKARVGRSVVDKTIETEWTKFKDLREWTNFDTYTCNLPYRIYCFEQ